MLGSIDCS